MYESPQCFTTINLLCFIGYLSNQWPKSLCLSITVIIIGVNATTPEVDERQDALVDVEILFGSLEKEVLVMLSTLDDSALGTCVNV